MVLVAEMRQLALILDNQFDILENVIHDGLSKETNPRARLAIYKHLVKRTEDLMESLHVNSRRDGDVDDILSGPKLVEAKSRFSASEKEISIKGNATGMYTSGSNAVVTDTSGSEAAFV
jgi:hypothetical protein